MNLIHYNPNRLLGNLDEFLNQTLRSFSPSPITPAPGAYRYEEKDSYRLRLDLPGFTREEIAISLENQMLTIIAKSEREDAFSLQLRAHIQPTQKYQPKRHQRQT